MKNIRNESGYNVLNFNASMGPTGAIGATGAIGGVANSWFLAGNTGVNASNFIGTRDNTPLLIATNGATGTCLRLSTKSQLEFLGPNILMGVSAGNSITGGATGNIFIGNNCGSNYVGGSNNLYIGNNNGIAFSGTENNNIFIGNNVGSIDDFGGFRGLNGVVVLGQYGVQTRCFIQGVYGHTPGAATVTVMNSAGEFGTTPSSKRFKNNIVDMGNQSEFIYNLRPVSFNYKNLQTETSFGLIAEEVNEICPEIVIKDKDGNCEGIQYHYLECMFLNELIKQKKIIDNLIQRIEILEVKINV